MQTNNIDGGRGRRIPANGAKNLLFCTQREYRIKFTIQHTNVPNLNKRQADHAADLLHRMAVLSGHLWESIGRIFDQKMDIL